MTINEAFSILMPFEGGDKYTENPNDLGKGTKYGISALAYPSLDIPNLTEAQALDIYTNDYWLKAGCDKITDSALQYLHFDTAVNCGVSEALHVAGECDTIGEYLFLREVHDERIVETRKEQIANLGGWTNRNVAIWEMYKQGKLI